MSQLLLFGFCVFYRYLLNEIYEYEQHFYYYLKSLPLLNLCPPQLQLLSKKRNFLCEIVVCARPVMTVIAWVALGEKIGFLLIFNKGGKTTFKILYGWLWFVY